MYLGGERASFIIMVDYLSLLHVAVIHSVTLEGPDEGGRVIPDHVTNQTVITMVLLPRRQQVIFTILIYQRTIK